MHGISESSFLLFPILTYLSRILTFCFPIGISKTDRGAISLRVVAKTRTKNKPLNFYHKDTVLKGTYSDKQTTKCEFRYASNVASRYKTDHRLVKRDTLVGMKNVLM